MELTEAFGANWLVWMAAALILGILEVMVPGFIFLGFAIGAALTGLVLLLLGLIPAALTAPVIAVLFAALSFAAWIGLRQRFRMKGRDVKRIDDDIND
ncbi:hypothetical protein A9Q95_12150 [Rhodobacterales bacterium 59_46_T64]|nr:hypothetical protein A9Q95_12150 [Rhodobacterales bacterium 59_46_T64]